MFDRICLLFHRATLGLIAAGIAAMLTGTIGWVGFTRWMILTIAAYVGGWLYYLMVMSDAPFWPIDFDL